MNARAFWIVPCNDGCGAVSLKYFTSEDAAIDWEQGEHQQGVGFADSCIEKFEVMVVDGEIDLDVKLNPERDDEGYEKYHSSDE